MAVGKKGSEEFFFLNGPADRLPPPPPNGPAIKKMIFFCDFPYQYSM